MITAKVSDFSPCRVCWARDPDGPAQMVARIVLRWEHPDPRHRSKIRLCRPCAIEAANELIAAAEICLSYPGPP